jgi:hypothetical protein
MSDAELEATSEIPKLEKPTGADGKIGKQPDPRQPKLTVVPPSLIDPTRVTTDSPAYTENDRPEPSKKGFENWLAAYYCCPIKTHQNAALAIPSAYETKAILDPVRLAKDLWEDMSAAQQSEFQDFILAQTTRTDDTALAEPAGEPAQAFIPVEAQLVEGTSLRAPSPEPEVPVLQAAE